MASIKVKPHYLDFLNQVAVGEGIAGRAFAAWAATTKDDSLRAVLELVAERETDHSQLFSARIEELGYRVDESAVPQSEFLEVLASDRSDGEKVAFLGKLFAPPADGAARGPSLDDRASDPSIDQVTRTLVRWFADEEKDSGERLREAFRAVRNAAGMDGKADANGQAASPPAYAVLLNQIAVGEGIAGDVLTAWAKASQCEPLREVLELVAAREYNHSRVFKARLEEFGCAVEPLADVDVAGIVAFFESDAPDTEKIERAAPTVSKKGIAAALATYEAAMGDESTDNVTRHLLQWYLDEERDSAKRLRAAYKSARRVLVPV